MPLVLGLWLTIGLPIYPGVSDTAGREGAMRDVLFDAQASVATGDGDSTSSAGLVAAAVVHPTIVRQVRLERLSAQAVAHVTRHARAPRDEPDPRHHRRQLVDRDRALNEPTSTLGARHSSAPPPAPAPTTPPLLPRPRRACRLPPTCKPCTTARLAAPRPVTSFC